LLARSTDYDTKHIISKKSTGTVQHDKKHKDKTQLSGAEENDLKKFFCFEGHTYPDTGVTAWVRRSKIPVWTLSDSCSFSLKKMSNVEGFWKSYSKESYM
jgi:hypothetical protein